MSIELSCVQRSFSQQATMILRKWQNIVKRNRDVRYLQGCIFKTQPFMTILTSSEIKIICIKGIQYQNRFKGILQITTSIVISVDFSTVVMVRTTFEVHMEIILLENYVVVWHV